ncbi:MAG: phosphotransferase family protein [Actinomycetia bacterium]|nr:phosphotransferase family protein [Actinomycetes bacterium]
MAESVAPAVDPTALEKWLATALPGRGDVEVDPLGEGHSNLTFLVRRGADVWVLRRPPLGPLLPTAHDVVREYRVLTLLSAAATPVRVPRAVAVCRDETVLGAPFYLMERTEGVVVRDRLPDWLADPADQRTLSLDVVDTLAEIHAVDWQPFVDAGIGKPGGYLERQLRRWVGQREGIQSAVAAAGGTARELPDYDAVRDWLRAHLPAEAAPAVVHGDYKLDNCIVGPGATPAVAAVVDWEMATVGDPRADLGYLLSFWPEPGEPFPLADLVAHGPGFPDRATMVSRWAERTGRDPGDPRWFVALAIWKLAILLEASYHRWLAGMADDPFFATLDTGVPGLLAHAREVCGA